MYHQWFRTSKKKAAEIVAPQTSFSPASSREVNNQTPASKSPHNAADH
jgi:hypothetical protein